MIAHSPGSDATTAMRFGVEVEMNGIPLGRLREKPTAVFILPTSALVRHENSNPIAGQEEFLGANLELRGTSIMQQELAETGQFSCVFSVDGQVT